MAEYLAGVAGSYGVDRAGMPTVASRSSNSTAMGGATSARKIHVWACSPLSRMTVADLGSDRSDESQGVFEDRRCIVVESRDVVTLWQDDL